MTLHDVHCHIDLYRDYDAVIREAEAARVFTLAVTNTPAVYTQCHDLVASTKFLHAAVGLHPQLVAARHRETDLLLDLIREVPYVGEVGLDFSDANPAVRLLQQDVLARILARCAEVGGRIVSLHSRRASRETIDLVSSLRPGTAILHWYSGPLRELGRAIDAGCYFSVNPSMIRSASGARLVRQIPLDRLLTETDGPFVEVAGRPATPANVSLLVEEIARLWQVEFAFAEAVLHQNLMRAFALVPDPWSIKQGS